MDPEGLDSDKARCPSWRRASCFRRNSFRRGPVAIVEAGIKTAGSHLYTLPRRLSAPGFSPDESQFLPIEHPGEIYLGRGISQQGSLQWKLGGAGSGGHSRDFSMGYPGADGADSGVRLNGKAPASPIGRSAGQTLGTHKTQQSFTTLHQNELVSPPSEARSIFILDTALPLARRRNPLLRHIRTHKTSGERLSANPERSLPDPCRREC